LKVPPVTSQENAAPDIAMPIADALVNLRRDPAEVPLSVRATRASGASDSTLRHYRSASHSDRMYEKDPTKLSEETFIAV
jgi:hypothetical protein